MPASYRRIFAFVVVSLAACGTSFTSVRTTQRTLVATPVQLTEMRAAIVRAMAMRRYAPEQDEPGQIVAKLERRGTRVRFLIRYTPTEYSIQLVETTGFETKRGPDGDVLVDARVAGWMRRLARDVENELGRPAREAAAEQDRQRQHVIAVAQASRPVVVAPPPAAPISIGIDVVAPAPTVAPVEIGSQHTMRQSSSSLTCCINGSSYVCPNEQAFNACVSLDPSQCSPGGSCG